MRRTDRANDLCDFCSGALHEGVTEIELRVEGDWLICENLPAQICQQCGEAYFSAKVTHQIDEIIAKRKELKPLRYETAPVFSPALVSSQ
ncbi:MAG: type II toxin-antitoxin system MqsA family antitoxin [Armatimonadetes bacterium]|nr:type II toxin-antitoxin system MqsA family antitoxin [Armatimonadota bacterium]PIU62226.1 MAG: hypothetical protein COS85_19190 [Armatimonadetes bacterium CG07_land_8_20_14_0_80_59_28]PIX42353.1 MAG: hypothetical protein COZ56_09575 [Armatimonadetes bacterium CG_4_8_14_3_um_filter_58_9]PIY42033.1 MAG: hypothetical protein COZ05_14685 [Armatimonadetes bacterium CG_4_10_14_3_um_filter_59_10]PJB62263.1 MAG: hypothetical protein CO095_18895 [Armatimonadetes bacterium CG_4_9_14_3_um_filter_58_7]